MEAILIQYFDTLSIDEILHELHDKIRNDLLVFHPVSDQQYIMVASAVVMEEIIKPLILERATVAFTNIDNCTFLF